MVSGNSPDKDLLQAIVNKDHVAFNILYKRYGNLFVHWAYLRTKDEDITKDITQIFWINIWLNAAAFQTDTNGNAKNFLLKILSYRITDYLKSAEGRKESSEKELQYAIDNESAMAYTHVVEEMEDSELHALILFCLMALPEMTRMVFELKWKGNHTTKETAELLHISEKTVKLKYKEAKRHLQSTLIKLYLNDSTLPKKELLLLVLLLQLNVSLKSMPEFIRFLFF